MFSKDAELRPLAKVNRLLPELGEICAWLPSLTPANLWLIENIGQLVHTMIKRYVDLMQLMMLEVIMYVFIKYSKSKIRMFFSQKFPQTNY
jgi:hypothetical protein